MLSFPSHCNNSPRKLFLQDFINAISKGDLPWMIDNLYEDLEWEEAGGIVIGGKKEVLATLVKHPIWKSSTGEVQFVITHGYEAAVSGFVLKGKKKINFCHVFRFTKASGSDIQRWLTFIG